MAIRPRERHPVSLVWKCQLARHYHTFHDPNGIQDYDDWSSHIWLYQVILCNVSKTVPSRDMATLFDRLQAYYLITQLFLQGNKLALLCLCDQLLRHLLSKPYLAHAGLHHSLASHRLSQNDSGSFLPSHCRSLRHYYSHTNYKLFFWSKIRRFHLSEVW